jgi:hypothetical protein
MSEPRYLLTTAIVQTVVAFIRAGGFPDVAAEAAGIPHQLFDSWRRQGEAPDAPQHYHDFAVAVRQAGAQGRLGAEVSIRDEKPLDWLRSGPGRETSDHPGWTGPARPRTASATGAALMDPRLQNLFVRILPLLEPHPETRSLLAAFVTDTFPEN